MKYKHVRIEAVVKVRTGYGYLIHYLDNYYWIPAKIVSYMETKEESSIIELHGPIWNDIRTKTPPNNIDSYSLYV